MFDKSTHLKQVCQLLLSLIVTPFTLFMLPCVIVMYNASFHLVMFNSFFSLTFFTGS